MRQIHVYYIKIRFVNEVINKTIYVTMAGDIFLLPEIASSIFNNGTKIC